MNTVLITLEPVKTIVKLCLKVSENSNNNIEI